MSQTLQDPEVALADFVMAVLDDDPALESVAADTETSPTGDDRDDTTLELCFNEAGNSALNLPNGYLEVFVLIVSWTKELDHLMVEDELSQLEDLFESRFKFKTKRLRLHTEKDPQLQLNIEMARFVYEYGGPGNLLIVYYGGHGSCKPGGQLFLSGRTRNDTKIGKHEDLVSWNKAEASSLLDAQADVLVVFDCCYASDIQRRTPTSCPRSYEVLAASGPGKTTPKHGFTPVFIEALTEMLEQRKDEQRISFNTRQLWQTISSKRSEDEQPFLWDRLGHLDHRYRSRLITLSPVDKPEITPMSLPDLSDAVNLTLHFTLNGKPTSDQVRDLARKLPRSFKKVGMRISRFRWGGLRRFNQNGPASLRHLVRPFMRVTRSLKEIRAKRLATNGVRSQTSN